MYEDCFFELVGRNHIEVEFIVAVNKAKRLLDLIGKEKMRIFCARIPT